MFIHGLIFMIANVLRIPYLNSVSIVDCFPSIIPIDTRFILLMILTNEYLKENIYIFNILRWKYGWVQSPSYFLLVCSSVNSRPHVMFIPIWQFVPLVRCLDRLTRYGTSKQTNFQSDEIQNARGKRGLRYAQSIIFFKTALFFI